MLRNPAECHGYSFYRKRKGVSSLKLHEEFLNRIQNHEKNINEQIFKVYFWYKPLSFSVKDLYEGNQVKNNTILKYVNE